jgi:arylsulfatase A-like enzyme
MGLIRGYLACVSFMDAQVGRVLDALQRTGLAENTTVVLTSDHGYCLGENSRWGKQTCFENSCRVPLIVAAPGAGPVQSSALVESVDIYPTLCDIAGAPTPAHVEGASMLTLLLDPSREWKTAAFSQFPRPVRESRPDAAAEPDDLMGRTMRTARHRFTLWHEVGDLTAVVARELYDYHADPNETRNLASDAAHGPLVAELEAQLVAGWRAAMPPRPDHE